MQKLPNYDLYGGAFYCSLTDDAVNEILKSNFTKRLLRKLRYSTCGEELFFQTILMHSELKDKIVNNHFRYMRWNVSNPPKILDETDYDDLIKIQLLFARKIDKEISKNLSVNLI